MKGLFQKNRIYPLLFFIVFFLVWKYREGNTLKKIEVSGKTMGTSYAIKYLDYEGTNYQKEIDSILIAFNQSLSIYIPESEISRFNKGTLHKFESPFFYPVLKKSREVYEKTQGAFNPAILPLVQAWGFGTDKKLRADVSKIDSLLSLVRFDSIFFDQTSVCKLSPDVTLDLGAIAKGYGADIIAEFLESKQIENFMVEIGGEIVGKGKNEKGNTWVIGINRPTEGNDQNFQSIVQLENRALATSGNYRNYYEKDGKKYAHTISPYTGYPVNHTLLSASVFSSDCMSADAYATAFMVLGLDESKKILESEPSLDAILIFSNDEGELETFTTPGIKPFIIK
jgi:FAD:protein FMN transferase